MQYFPQASVRRGLRDFFDNKTITSRNLGDQSEKVVEKLKDAETIKFEWIDTKLYWFYINNGLEEYGGCCEFK